MGRYPKTVRDAAIKCVACNAPVAKTVAGSFACVDCGESPVMTRAKVSTDKQTADD
jgi:predicted RNA-binding Zn-ribbon protein involved in translation (DUF1610 family)